MSRYTIVLLGLLAMMVTVYAEGNGGCRRDNEKLDICGKICEPSCQDPKPIRELCPSIECSKFTADYRCDRGYLRDTDGSCVLPKDCQKQKDQQ